MASGKRDVARSLGRDISWARIDAIDRVGNTLRSVICAQPQSGRRWTHARALDAERAAGQPAQAAARRAAADQGDNIETSDGTATTAGSLALAANVTLRDAPCVARLKAAGAVILGKTNLSEWANIRSASGWSGVGGLVKNPYVLDRGAAGSSSGTGAAIAASLAAAGVGTETDGSITAPSAYCGLVGFKPTLGLVSRTHVIPILGQPGHARADGAQRRDRRRDPLLTGMGGIRPGRSGDRRGGRTAHQLRRGAARGASLAGKRLGLLRHASKPPAGGRGGVRHGGGAAEGRGRGGGRGRLLPTPASTTSARTSTLVLPERPESEGRPQRLLRHHMPAAVEGPRALADVIAFNPSDAARDGAVVGQGPVRARPRRLLGLDDPASFSRPAPTACGASLALRGDRPPRSPRDRLDALIGADPMALPARGPDAQRRIHFRGGGSTHRLPGAIAGYPHLDRAGDGRGSRACPWGCLSSARRGAMRRCWRWAMPSNRRSRRAARRPTCRRWRTARRSSPPSPPSLRPFVDAGGRAAHPWRGRTRITNASETRSNGRDGEGAGWRGPSSTP